MDNADWRTFFENSEEFTKIPEPLPGLSGNALSHLHVDEREAGVAVAMGFDFRIPAEAAPEEWADHHFNAFEVSLEFTRVRDVRIDGWARELDCRVELSRNSDGTVDVTVSGTGEHVSFTAGRARVSRFRAYRAATAEG